MTNYTPMNIDEISVTWPVSTAWMAYAVTCVCPSVCPSVTSQSWYDGQVYSDAKYNGEIPVGSTQTRRQKQV